MEKAITRTCTLDSLALVSPVHACTHVLHRLLSMNGFMGMSLLQYHCSDSGHATSCIRAHVCEKPLKRMRLTS